MGKKKGPKYNQIIDAAVTVIAKHGYHQAQVAKIAREAGVADGTIYLYFKNKEDILTSLFEEKMGRFVETIRTKIESCQTVDEKFLLLMTTHFEQLEADKQLAIVTQLELRQSNTDLRLKINDILKGYLTLMDELITEGKESGYFDPELDNRLARQMIFGTLDEVVTNWVMKDCKYDLSALAKPLHQMLLGGFCKR
ncbi:MULTISPECIES: TetR/AcrR family transcriptional regulator [Alkalihalophilus]|uniref:TetR family transcriptional regulator n=3 Tax=Alkalihalophilus TaxID=2893060 RepID=D3FWG7_ALKPO|nr:MULTISPECIES: TetR/AcrR family transcriptional regulator [Alkalihalophilus]ADC48699.1 TetR family transcriptional regulator [Alkalihalophilus pseudofirmus OF4]ERN52478.1 TetR family transcriptional regulator [Alkalihalophilus marmarensis DSM 21297]MCM3487829.1 TetR family transcriptional regulator [Alkalihalophilus marmarensis]MDV2885868.1 TetR/AcrR family transcriptional regulator [Alkalihalophilus pseudofirmus]MEC2071679.1 TetR/AcrR family transcriptional regulator [Alkalihalophilus marma